MASTKLEAILCDLDDTLIPTSKIADAAINAAIDAIILKGVEYPREQLCSMYLDIRKEFGSKCKNHLDIMFERLKVPKIRANELISAARRRYHIAAMSLMPFHDVYGTLHQLKDYRKYIVTDGNSLDQWDKMDACGFDKNLFDGVFITEDYTFATKSDKFYRIILDNINAKANCCAMIGDKFESDIKPARSLGLHTVRVLTGKFKDDKYENDADYVIPRFSDILKVIPQIEQKL